MNTVHQPVLLTESVDGLLNGSSSGYYIDATFGRGGHSRAILHALGPEARLLMMDQDPEASPCASILCASDARAVFVSDSFAYLTAAVAALGWMGRVQGMLLDLGVSSTQLDDAHRGFSFMKDGPLDMRMNPERGVSAASWLRTARFEEIEQVLRTYGQERFSRRIARALVNERIKQPIEHTGHLSDVICRAHPRWSRHRHPATRSFQAIRIWINRELDALSAVLEQASAVLAPQGRLCVLSFHSLEDRLVKHGMRTQDWMRCGKWIAPGAEEQRINPRSRSAKLRIAEKK